MWPVVVNRKGKKFLFSWDELQPNPSSPPSSWGFLKQEHVAHARPLCCAQMCVPPCFRKAERGAHSSPSPFISLVLFFLGCLDIQVSLILIASAMQNDSEWIFGQWTGFLVIDRPWRWSVRIAGAPHKRVPSATAVITPVKASSSVHFTMFGS